MSLKQRKWDGSLWMSRDLIIKNCRQNAGFFVVENAVAKKVTQAVQLKKKEPVFAIFMTYLTPNRNEAMQVFNPGRTSI